MFMQHTSADTNSLVLGVQVSPNNIRIRSRAPPLDGRYLLVRVHTLSVHVDPFHVQSVSSSSYSMQALAFSWKSLLDRQHLNGVESVCGAL